MATAKSKLLIMVRVCKQTNKKRMNEILRPELLQVGLIRLILGSGGIC